MNRLITLILFFIIGNCLFAQNSKKQDPVKNFDYLWNEFNERYAFFELKSVDWDSVYKKYRPLINSKTINDSLFSVCNQMLLELKDGHVSLEQYDKNGETINESEDGHENVLLKKFPRKKTSQPNIYQLRKLTWNSIKSKGFKKGHESKSGTLKYHYSNEYGYLKINNMYRFKHSEIKTFFKLIAENLESEKGLIIDIRHNPGGHDRNSLKIAGRFTDKKRVAFYKKERIKGTNSYKELETRFVEPKGKNQFTKPIILLTSDYTASAADIFTMTLKEFPHVTILGDNTQGIFSDKYSFRLPNRWHVSLSHQQYFTAAMINYEGVGIAPHIRMLNEPEDIVNGIDPLIVKAIELLDVKNNMKSEKYEDKL